MRAKLVGLLAGLCWCGLSWAQTNATSAGVVARRESIEAAALRSAAYEKEVAYELAVNTGTAIETVSRSIAVVATDLQNAKSLRAGRINQLNRDTPRAQIGPDGSRNKETRAARRASIMDQPDIQELTRQVENLQAELQSLQQEKRLIIKGNRAKLVEEKASADDASQAYRAYVYQDPLTEASEQAK